MKDINEKFIKFVDETPNSYYCVMNIRKILSENGFEELYENMSWDNLKDNGKYFVVRGDSSLIAFKLIRPIENIGFNIVAAHTDSPSFTIKPNAEMYDQKYLKLNTEGYGGMIDYSWFDRPLSIAGRVIIKNGENIEKKLINIDKDLLIIPSQARHINLDVNNKNATNHQKDTLPIMALTDNYKIYDLIHNELLKNGENVDEILDYDLYLYNRDKARIVGANDEFIISPRLDDLASVFPAIYSFVTSSNDNSINVLSAFDKEEIGNVSMNGANSTFLFDVLNRISSSLGIPFHEALANSFTVSADNAHAIHPNAPEKSDPTNIVELNKGIVIKHHTKYTTDSLSASTFKEICKKSSIPYQDFACRSDMICGSTLGKESLKHISIDSVDIGIPQLAMHSANETMGTKDLLYLYKSLLEFYNTTIIRDKNIIKLVNKRSMK